MTGKVVIARSGATRQSRLGGAPRFHKLMIGDIRRETDDALSLAFAVPTPLARAYRFQPGQ
jgi:hypothetical protein